MIGGENRFKQISSAITSKKQFPIKPGIRAFINIGGSWANIGTDPEVLKLQPGLARIRKIPESDRRGVLQEMALRKDAVIHLLHIRGLCERYGLPWDSMPLPRPGEGELYRLPGKSGKEFLALGVIYLLAVALVLVFQKKGTGAFKKRERAPQVPVPIQRLNNT